MLVVDGTLVPTRDHGIAEQSENYRYSTGHQVVSDADTRLVDWWKYPFRVPAGSGPDRRTTTRPNPESWCGRTAGPLTGRRRSRAVTATGPGPGDVIRCEANSSLVGGVETGRRVERAGGGWAAVAAGHVRTP